MPTKVNLTKFEIHFILNLVMKVGNIDNRKKNQNPCYKLSILVQVSRKIVL